MRKYVVTSLWTSVGVSMGTPPFTMRLFQGAHGQVAVWCEYSSSETDDRIASFAIGHLSVQNSISIS